MHHCNSCVFTLAVTRSGVLIFCKFCDVCRYLHIFAQFKSSSESASRICQCCHGTSKGEAIAAPRLWRCGVAFAQPVPNLTPRSHRSYQPNMTSQFKSWRRQVVFEICIALRSGPIIEHCQRVSFAPNDLDWPEGFDMFQHVSFTSVSFFVRTFERLKLHGFARLQRVRAGASATGLHGRQGRGAIRQYLDSAISWSKYTR